MSAYHHSTPSRDWKGCQQCQLHTSRRHVVVRRSGLVESRQIFHHIISPSDKLSSPHILIIGEAPGQLEDLVGVPFWGEAGRILDLYLTSLLLLPFYFTITNVVCCRPTNEHGQNRQPTEAEILLCAPHIKELTDSYKFAGIITLGEVAKTSTSLNLVHPAFIARKDYKHLLILKEARKLQRWLSNLK